MNGKQIISELKKSGWTVKRIKGSHHMMTNGRVTFPVAVHGSKDIPIGTLKNIEKLSGVKLK